MSGSRPSGSGIQPPEGQRSLCRSRARWFELWREEALDDEEIVERLAQRLMGREIDGGLACLANGLLRRCLTQEYGVDPTLASTLKVITEADTLAVEYDGGADHEIGNPPFLRLAAKDEPLNAARFDDIRSGRLNLYSIFVWRGLAALPPGGVLAYIIPASFIGGPEFHRFRVRVRQVAEVLAVDMIEGRSSVFMDVVQDTCVLILRRRSGDLVEVGPAEAASNTVGGDGVILSSGIVRLSSADGPWILPGRTENLPSSLFEWGYAARIGYLVANSPEGPASRASSSGSRAADLGEGNWPGWHLRLRPRHTIPKAQLGRRAGRRAVRREERMRRDLTDLGARSEPKDCGHGNPRRVCAAARWGCCREPRYSADTDPS